MYLDYESFVDCLIKSGYTKKCSGRRKAQEEERAD